MNTDITALQDQVAATRTTIDSAVLLIKGIADRLDAAGTDAEALQSLVTDLRGSTAALATAVVANTLTPGVPVDPVW